MKKMYQTPEMECSEFFPTGILCESETETTTDGLLYGLTDDDWSNSGFIEE